MISKDLANPPPIPPNGKPHMETDKKEQHGIHRLYDRVQVQIDVAHQSNEEGGSERSEKKKRQHE